MSSALTSGTAARTARARREGVLRPVSHFVTVDRWQPHRWASSCWVRPARIRRAVKAGAKPDARERAVLKGAPAEHTHGHALGRASWATARSGPEAKSVHGVDLYPFIRTTRKTRRYGAGMNLGPSLKGLRLRAGLKQTDLAARMGCTASAIAAVENEVRRPSIDLLERWLRATGGRLRIEEESRSGSVIDAEEESTVKELRALDNKGWTTVMLLVRIWSHLDESERRLIGILFLGLASDVRSRHTA